MKTFSAKPAEVTKKSPEKSLLAPLPKTGGRNHHGKITARGIGGGAKIMTSGGGGGHSSDAVSALTGLGFKPGEAGNAVAQAVEELGADATLDALVRLALKRAAK